jgi:hypothetical protein
LRSRAGPLTVYRYAWGDNPRRAQLKGRLCVVVADGGKMRTVLVEFPDTGERVATSARALRRADRGIQHHEAGVARQQNYRALSTAEEDRMSENDYAFPKEQKEPLFDASHVRNAVARFDQVEGVTDEERDEAWKRIQDAAKRFDVKIEADDWRELSKGGKP